MKRILIFLFFLFQVFCSQAQKDTARKNNIYSSVDDYEELFDDLESFIDSITRPRDFALVNVGVSNRSFDYSTGTSTNYNISTRKYMTLLPSVGYFSKSGLGVSLAASLVNEDKTLNPYQFSASASYDFIQNRSIITGVSFTRFFTKDSLKFYTSPLQNEVFAYFLYRKSFIKPSISASYGWGSRSEVEERKSLVQEIIKKGKKKENANNGNGNGNGNGNPINNIEFVERLTSIERIRDLNVSLSVRHDFYWLSVFVSDDYVRFTPQFTFTGGTQNYGFNQSVNIITNKRNLKGDLLPVFQEYALDEKTKFKPLSVSAFLKTEFSKGKFFLQPQMIFDYYLPSNAQKLYTNFIVNTGLMF